MPAIITGPLAISSKKQLCLRACSYRVYTAVDKLLLKLISKMENEDWSVNQASQQRAFCSEEKDANDLGCMQDARRSPFSAKEEVKRTVRSLVERFGLSREDLVSSYDECMLERERQRVRVEKNDTAFVLQKQSPSRGTAMSGSSRVQVNGASDFADGSVMDAQEEGDVVASTAAQEEKDDGITLWEKENDTRESRLESVSDGSPMEEKEEVDKMQSLVQSALRVYEATSMTPELGQKRRCFTLEEELTLQPTPFAQELLE